MSLLPWLERCVGTRMPDFKQGGAADWMAVKKWSPEYLSAAIGEERADVMAIRDGNVRLKPDGTNASPGNQFNLPDVQIAGALRNIFGSKEGDLRYYLYQKHIAGCSSSLWADLDFPEYGESSEVNLWVGSAGIRAPLHFDLKDNVFVQVYGRKNIDLYSPDDSQFLYQYPQSSVMRHLSHVDLSSVDLSLYPEFSKAVPHSFTLDSGDVLFIPEGWWHSVTSVSASISVSRWFHGPDVK